MHLHQYLPAIYRQPEAQPAAPTPQGPRIWLYRPAHNATLTTPVLQQPFGYPCYTTVPYTHAYIQAPPAVAVPPAPAVPSPAPANVFYYGAPGAYSYPASPAPAAPQMASGTTQNPYPWFGNTTDEVNRQNLVIAQRSGATQPAQLVPMNATDGQLWWCRELDGAYTMRTIKTINESLQPGYWAFAQQGGYPYFIRRPAT
ncbi:MAG: hypothetical protein M1825_001675 [Sarcosagium campestre]|nr:MAG: hypothetical protein M1825_001675 [Sarcosagium campestre]